MIWNIAGFIKSWAISIVIHASRVFNAAIFPVANVSGRTVFIFFTTTEMWSVVVAANGEEFGTVVILNTT